VKKEFLMQEAMPITKLNLKHPVSPVTRRSLLGAFIASSLGVTALAQEKSQRNREELQEPVFRQANRNGDAKRGKGAAPHPLDEAIGIAEDALDNFRANYDDYTAYLHKRERVGGVTGELEVATVKIRNRKEEGGVLKVPFGVYIKFVKPVKIAGREALWVEGANSGKMIGHKARGESVVTISAWLLPTSNLAMAGQLYPITEIGIENLINKLIERGGKERAHGDVDVEWTKNVINKRPCRVLTLLHPEKDARFDFHKAQIFIDDAFGVPVRYVAYDWPKGDKLAASDILEEYTYTDIKFNVGLTDKDFDSRNKSYNF
jgi:hypothetical protein